VWCVCVCVRSPCVEKGGQTSEWPVASHNCDVHARSDLSFEILSTNCRVATNTTTTRCKRLACAPLWRGYSTGAPSTLSWPVTYTLVSASSSPSHSICALTSGRACSCVFCFLDVQLLPIISQLLRSLPPAACMHRSCVNGVCLCCVLFSNPVRPSPSTLCWVTLPCSIRVSPLLYAVSAARAHCTLVVRTRRGPNR
jgi:hypothetical protein